MLFKSILLVFLGGGLGSVLRFLIGKGAISLVGGNLPLGTFVSNMLACVILGFVIQLTKSREAIWSTNLVLMMIVGFCGGLSTFSTFSFESMELMKSGQYWHALLNILLSLLFGILAIYYLSQKISPNESI